MSSISSILSGERPAHQGPKEVSKNNSDNDSSETSGSNTESLMQTQTQQETEEAAQANQHRKRSKVSRACDECRRKKIRCDATFSAHSNTLEKSCTSCAKNNYVCTFDRVPLKRGPTKGYSRNDSTSSLPENNRTSNANFGHPQGQPQITLPPLTSLTGGFQTQQQRQQQQQQQQQPTQNLSQPASPRHLSINDKVPQMQIANPNNPNAAIPQSQFWKVPYEPPFDRRGSVDSISSSLSDGRFTFAQQNPQFSIRQSKYSESSIVSDSEDDLRSVSSSRNSIDMRDIRSRSNSQSNGLSLPMGPVSPALSMASTQSNNYSLNKLGNLQQPTVQSIGAVPIPPISTNHLIDSYYRFIHPNMPILPLNNQSLVNMLSKPSKITQNEFDELNRFIIQNFYNSLDILISIVSEHRTLSSPSNMNSGGVHNQNRFLENLNLLFTGLSKVFNKVVNQFDQFQQQTMVIFLSTLVLLSYCEVLLGDQADVLIINSSVMLFNRIKIYKLFWSAIFEKRTNNDFDDYHFTLRRLWVTLNTLFSIHCISHGLPNAAVIDVKLNQIDQLFPIFQGVDNMKDILKLGSMLSKIASLRDFSNDNQGQGSGLVDTFLNGYLKKENNFSSTRELFGTAIGEDSLPSLFFEFIITKFELIGFLEEVTINYKSNVQSGRYDEDSLYDYQTKLSRIIKKKLTTQSNLFSMIKNHTNSMDTNNNSLLISPLLPLIFRQSIKNLNILKILINSLQLNESILNRLSKLLNDLIKLTNIISMIKPFIDNQLNNHLKFKFISKYAEFWENIDSNTGFSNPSNTVSGNGAGNKIDNLKIQDNWYGLMFDLLKFYKMDDFEGWF